MLKEVGVVDIGLGNVKSVSNMISHVGGIPKGISTPECLKNVNKVILPGVGSFDKGMALLSDTGMLDALNEIKLEGKYIMGICLGMQLLANSSEEGSVRGLGWINANVKRFDDTKVIVPHMGWSSIDVESEASLSASLFDVNELHRFYFVHSYYMSCIDSNDVLATSQYGEKQFVCGVARDNVIGFQFHPEKSHKFGMNLMKRFIDL